MSTIATLTANETGADSRTDINNNFSNLNADKLEASDISSLTDKTTPVNADSFPIVDSEALNVLKKLTFTNLKAFLKTYFDTLYGSGDVTGPASSTDNAITRFDSTTGKIIQNSSATVDDAGLLSTDSVTLTTRINTPEIKATGAGGVDIHNNAGTQVAIFGAGGSTGSSLVGTTNIASSSADYHQVAGGTGTITDTATGSSTNISINLVPK